MPFIFGRGFGLDPHKDPASLINAKLPPGAVALWTAGKCLAIRLLRLTGFSVVASKQRGWVQGLLFGLMSAAAVCLVFWLGRELWQQALPGWAQHTFWLASAVNLAGLLALGWRYFPWIWLSAPIVVWVFGEPVAFSFAAATGNVIEALVGVWIVRRWGRFHRAFDRTRTVLALMVASFLAPVPGTAVIPFWLFVERQMDFEQFRMAIWTWSFSNGAALILLTPFLRMLFRWPTSLRERWGELVWGVVGIVAVTWWTFGEVFRGQGMNFAFLIFPVLILVAVRLGPGGAAVGCAALLGAVYAALIVHAPQMDLARAAEIIWFTQAFCWVLAATGLLVAALVAERQGAQRLLANAKTRVLNASLRAERARLDALRYQINPHFLFNALNSIRGTIPASGELSREMVTELAGYLRSTLTRSEDDLASVRDEVEMARQYLAIEQKRFPDDLRVEIQVAADLEEKRLPVYLLQPLVENAIRHGFSATKGRLELRISVRREAGRLVIEVANSGVWREPDPARPHLGLENIRHRLELLYGQSASLVLRTDEGWVRARIELPESFTESSHALPDR